MAEAPVRPTLFVLLAQDGFLTATRPALRHAVKVLVESNPNRWEFLWSWFDELYCLLELTLQHHYLTSTGASFSENFYGLKRVPQFPRSTKGWLPLWEHRVSLLLLVAGPYLRVKLTKLFQRLRDERDFGVVFPHTARARLQQLFLSTYPFAVLMWEGITLNYQLCYALGKVKRHSILLWFAGVYLSHLTSQDTAKLAKQLQEGENFSHEAGLIGRIASTLKSVYSGTTVSISSAFSILVFFLQFLEYWYAAGAREATAADPFGPWCPTPPAPTHLEVHGESTEKCPICLRPRSNPAVLSTSGYVFCYPCVYNYIRTHRSCPVTGCPSSPRQMVRLFAPDHHGP
uniref:peroxisome assembly protein 12 n=1 Tax=Myxine glutinosa TaxID=7769 RepID=UPI00359025AF